MLRIVEDLMSLSRIEAERFMAPREAVDLGEVARLAADHAQAADRARSPARSRSRSRTAWRRSPATSRQLLQMADNLVANAIRYGCTATRHDSRRRSRAGTATAPCSPCATTARASPPSICRG